MEFSSSLSLEKVLYISNVIYLIGVGVAAVASVLIYLFASRLSAVKDAELQRFRSESAQAIAQANARAAEANLKAEQEALARAKIEEQLAPRVLEPDQKDRMVEELKELSGTEFTANVFNDPEALMLLYNLLEVFERAGWILRPSAAGLTIPTTYGLVGATALSTGVTLRTPRPLEQKALKAFTAFRFSGLKNAGVLVSAPELLTGMIQLEVGKKDTTPQ